MKHRPTEPAARLRGTAAGLLTGALAAGAHGVANGVPPSGAAMALLCVLAATVGAVAGTSQRASDPRVLLGLLAMGQALGHITLATAGHGHAGMIPAQPAPVMVLVHVLALGAGAALIAGSERLWRALSSALRACVHAGLRPSTAAAGTATTGADQPLHSALVVAVSISRRGPPVGSFC